MDVENAIRTLKKVGLNVYTPSSKDSGFVKVYTKPVRQLLPKISGNALKVLLALSGELEWNDMEVIMSVDELCKITGLQKTAVQNSLNELEKSLAIKRLGPNVRRSYQVSNCYVRVGKNK